MPLNWWGDDATPDPPPMDPNDAADILRKHFGMLASTNPDSSEVIGDPSGAIALSRNRRSLQQELEDRVANDKFAADLGPQTGFEPGSPGKRFVSNLPAANLNAARSALVDTERDQSTDPYTGTAETARLGGITRALDTAATTLRPEVADAAKATATRNAFAEFLKSHSAKLGEKMGEYEAASSPEAYAAALTPIRAAGSAESQDVLEAANRRAVELANVKKPGVKYSTQEQATLDTASSVQQLGTELMQLLEQDNPGIAQDPTKYGSWTDVIKNAIGGSFYRKGKTSTVNSDRINTLTGYLEAAVPRMLTPNRLNQTQYNDLKLHAPQVGFSEGANYERMRTILSDIMPKVLRGIDAAHGANPTGAPGPGQEDPYAPPSDDQLGLPNPYASNR